MKKLLPAPIDTLALRFFSSRDLLDSAFDCQYSSVGLIQARLVYTYARDRFISLLVQVRNLEKCEARTSLFRSRLTYIRFEFGVAISQ